MKSPDKRKLQSGSVHPLLDALTDISDLFINFFHICLEGTIGAEITKQSILLFADLTIPRSKGYYTNISDISES